VYGNARQTGATVEHIITDHVVLYSYACKTGTIGERTQPDTRHAVGYGNARQTGTTVERALPDTRYAVRYSNARQSCTTIERVGRNVVAACYNDCFQRYRNISILI